MHTPEPTTKRPNWTGRMTPEGRATKGIIRSQLALRGWKWPDLAKAAGLSIDGARQIACGNPIRTGRRAIELALEMPIWTPLHEFEALAHRAAFLGIDPVLSTWVAIRARCREVGCGISWTPKKPTKAELLAGLEAHLSTHMQNQNQPAHV